VKILVVVGLLAGCAMVYEHWILGVLVLVAAAWAVPIVIHQIHDDHTAVERRR
jgi:hypothetical protein